MGRGVGGSNLGQTQVELSGLNRVSHELGPQGEWMSTYTDSFTSQAISLPTWGEFISLSVSHSLACILRSESGTGIWGWENQGLELCSPLPLCGDPSQGTHKKSIIPFDSQRARWTRLFGQSAKERNFR